MNSAYKVVLIRPPKIMGALERSMVQHPINLLMLAGAVRAAGFAVEVWDLEVEPNSEAAVRRRAQAARPDLVGVTGLTCNVTISHRILGCLKEELPGVFTVIGGPHASALPERTLEEFPGFDAAVRGEGEDTLVEICRRLSAGGSLAGVAGTAWRNGDRIVLEPARPLIEDLDRLPFPARDLIDHSLYRGASSPGLDATLHRGTMLFTSRGCPDDCTFCAAKVTFGRTVRARSAEHVLAEVDECIARWGYRHYTVEDDTFTYRPSRLEKLCQGFRERGITWDCDTRVNVVTREMIRMFAETGCQKIAFGVESGSPRILEKIQKGITVEQVKRAFAWAHEFGLITTAFFMVGSDPSETEADLELSFRLMKEIDTELIALAIAVPFPGTRFHQEMKDRGFLFAEAWDKFTHLHSVPCWRTEHFSPEQLVHHQMSLYARFFLRPGFIWKTLPKALSWRGFRYYTRSLWHVLQYLFLESRN
jgi:anaerobic magnesium-protoporphyrin IX monomethyl ester cyclase